MHIQLRKFLNFLKLYLAFAFLFAGAMSVFNALDQGLSADGRDVLGIYFAIGFSVTIAILLIFWYLNGRKKIRAIDPARKEGVLTSTFAFHYPKFVQFFDGISIRGIGNKFYTRHHKRDDGTVEAIRWFKIIMYPLVPLYQARILIKEDHDEISNKGIVSASKLAFEIIEKTPINRRLIKKTYAFYYGLIFPLMFVPIPIAIMADTEIKINFPGSQFWWLILAYFIWGIVLIFVSEWWNKRNFK